MKMQKVYQNQGSEEFLERERGCESKKALQTALRSYIELQLLSILTAPRQKKQAHAIFTYSIWVQLKVLPHTVCRYINQTDCFLHLMYSDDVVLNTYFLNPTATFGDQLCFLCY